MSDCLQDSPGNSFLPLCIWDTENGGQTENQPCYWSSWYEKNPRDPWSHVMASYTASIYCPDAPLAKLTPPSKGKDRETVDNYRRSLSNQVQRYSSTIQSREMLTRNPTKWSVCISDCRTGLYNSILVFLCYNEIMHRIVMVHSLYNLHLPRKLSISL